MYVPTINDFEKLTDDEAQAYIGQVMFTYNQARMSRFVRAYCNQNRLSRCTYDSMMQMSNIQPHFQNTCKAVVKQTGAVCTRCALPEYGGLFCGYHRKQYDRHKREQTNNHKTNVTKKNNRGKKLEI